MVQSQNCYWSTWSTPHIEKRWVLYFYCDQPTFLQDLKTYHIARTFTQTGLSGIWLPPSRVPPTQAKDTVDRTEMTESASYATVLE